MKTTLEIPDQLFRRAKSMASEDGKSLKQFVNEALTEKIAVRARSLKPAWLKLFGSLKAHGAELRRIDRAIADEFEQIEPEEWK